MKKFSLTKQLFAAALVVAVGFTGCQKSEMEEVSPLGASNSQEVIAGACGATSSQNVNTTYNIPGRNQGKETLQSGVLEMGNDNDKFYVQFSIPKDENDQYVTTVHGIVEASFLIVGNTEREVKVFNPHDGEKVALFQILRADLPNPSATSVQITDVILKVRQADGSGNWENDAIVVQPWVFVPCPSSICSLDKDGWKNENIWPFSSLSIGANTGVNAISEVDLRILLSTGNASRNAVKLAQAYTVAKLNQASSGKPDLDAAILDAEKLFNLHDGVVGNEINVFAGPDVSRITPGLIGKLHHLPSCD